MIRRAIISLALCSATWAGTAVAASPNWVISAVSGGAVVRDGSKLTAARRGQALAPGNLIRTAAGARVLLVRGNDFVVVSPNTQLRLPVLTKKPSLIQVIEDYGAALFKIEHRPNPHFAVQTRYLAAVVKGTTFRVSSSDSGAVVRVVQGAVNVKSQNGTDQDLVTQHLRATVLASAPTDVRVAEAPAAGANESEDLKVLAVNGGVTASELPAEEPWYSPLGFGGSQQPQWLRAVVAVVAVFSAAFIGAMLLEVYRGRRRTTGPRK